MADEYIVQCWYCLGEYDAFKAAWCGHPEPTKICPYCLNCSCSAPEDYKKKFWEEAPEKLKIERIKLTSLHERLGELLISDKKILSEQLLAALNIQKRTGEKIGQILVKMGLITEEELQMYLLKQKKVPTVDIEMEDIDLDLVSRVGIETCLKYKILPFSIEEIDDKKRVHLAMVNPYMPSVIKKVASLFDADVIYYQTPKEKMEKKLKSILQSLRIKEVTKLDKNKGIVKNFIDILKYSIGKKATHIYLSQEFSRLKISLRINGLLFKVKSINLSNENFLKLLKVSLGFKENKKIVRKTFDFQDKRFNIIIYDQSKDERELSLTVRILDLSKFGKDLKEIGLSEYALLDIENILEEGKGVILFSAPPFNDLDSLMYSVMDFVRKNYSSKTIVSFEKEFLRRLPGIEQTLYVDGKKESFLDVIYKVEPDIVFVHNLKDIEISQDIFRLSKNILFIVDMYSKSAIKSIQKLADYFNIDPNLIADNLKLVVNQRMIRVLCNKCKIRVKPKLEFISKLNLSEEDSMMSEFYREQGCPNCNYTGFEKRIPIFEVLKINDSIKEKIKEGIVENEILNFAVSEGFIPLRNSANAMLSKGLTSVNELMRQGFL